MSYTCYSKPRPQQADAAKVLLKEGRAIWEMPVGVGKTFAALYVAEKVGARYILVVCPKGVFSTWEREIHKHGVWKGRVLKLDRGNTKDKRSRLNRYMRLDDDCIVIVNHESWWRGNLGFLIEEIVWDMVVIDECQKIANAESMTSTFAARVGHLNHDTTYKVAMSGTVMHNQAWDVFGSARFVDESVLGEYVRFKAEHLIIGETRQVIGIRDEPGLAKKLSKIYFQCKKDRRGLPDTQDLELIVDMDSKTKKFYKEMKRDLAAWYQDHNGDWTQVTAANAGVKLMKLVQVGSGRVLTETSEVVSLNSAKAEALTTLAETVPETLAVVAWHRETLQQIQDVAQKLGRPYYEISGRNIPEGFDEWMADGADPSIVGIQYRSGAGFDGLQTRCHNMVFFEICFSTGLWEQVRGRIDRQGQRTTVDGEKIYCNYHLLMMEGSADQYVLEMLKDKSATIKRVVERIVGDDS